MYLKQLYIKNVGPLEELYLEMPFNENNEPKPIVFVGENGSGKTILLSSIVEGLFEIGAKLFDDVLPPYKGSGHKYYRICNATNRRLGFAYNFTALRFEQSGSKCDFLDKAGTFEISIIKDKLHDFLITSTQTDHYQKSISIEANAETLKNEFRSGSYFYLPAYRFEEPFWKNEKKDLDSRIGLYSTDLNKEIEIISSLSKNKAFLMDIIFDSSIYKEEPDLGKIESLHILLQKIKQKDDLYFSLGPRYTNRIWIVETKNNKFVRQTLPSIDNLSLGEISILSIFLNILRHADEIFYQKMEQIRGIVLIDEIDVHLHSNLQMDALPKLIKLFPKVQFILTTHSPLFLLGMEKNFGGDEFEVRELPSGEKISAERFSEFGKAYEAFKQTKTYEDELMAFLKQNKKPILFVEGETDILYIRKATDFCGKSQLIEEIEIRDGKGFGSLDKIWNKFDSSISKIIPQKIMLLYDCDEQREDKPKDNITRKNIPQNKNNPIKIGIENLFSSKTIDKITKTNSMFIDHTKSTSKRTRGEDQEIPEIFEVNENEKSNLCKWLCDNGTKEDFEGFNCVFDIIEETLLN